MSFFRRHQKTVMVTMGVILMVTFTVGGSLSMLPGFGGGGGGGSGTGPDETVVTWQGGRVTQKQLEAQQMMHIVAVNFLRDVIASAVEKGGSPVVGGRRIPKETPVNQIAMMSPGIPADSSEPTLVRTMLMARKAEQLGVTVDHRAVREFLNQLSAGILSESDWELLARDSVPSGMAVSFNQLLDHLAFELKAQHAQILAAASFMNVSRQVPQFGYLPLFSTGEAWDYFNRLNRRFSIEAYPIDVTPLMAQVGGTPTEAELIAIFEKGRSRYPDPASPEPGFRKPQKVAFDYLKISMAPFLAEAKKQITDEQVAKEYEAG
ncbi:MAG: hypothetical protein SFU86_09365, partial [Pirellulaceae bacterium]|nr:hypothetical protein [Pirellulaceae bacterium]